MIDNKISQNDVLDINKSKVSGQQNNVKKNDIESNITHASRTIVSHFNFI